MYLMLCTDDYDKGNPCNVYNEVSYAILAMNAVAKSYDVHFSDTLIRQLYDELKKHVNQMEKR